LRRGPDVSDAARSGAPAMTAIKPAVPPSVPQAAGAGGTGGAFTGDVTATTVSGPSALDTQPDARANPPAAADGAKVDNSQTQQSTPVSDSAKNKKKKKDKKQKQAPVIPGNPATQPPVPSSN
jgi:hypothetical protein